MPQIKDLLGGKSLEDSNGLKFRWEPGRVTVEFRNGRQQLIEYRIEGEYYVFRSVIAKRAVVERVGRKRIAKEILLRNRVTDVVAFQLTNASTVEGHIVQRAATLQADEARFYLALLAQESDRFEYLLTGRDQH